MQEIFLILLGAALGWGSQWLLELRKERREQSRGPQVVIAKHQTDDHLFVELHNLGPDGLTEMDVLASYEQGGRTQRSPLKSFFESADGTGSASFVEYLAPSERRFVGDIPSWSDDGIVTILVSGLGQRSQRLYETRTQITVQLGAAPVTNSDEHLA